MKRFFLLTLISTFVAIVSAQPPAIGSTRHYPDLDKYTGIWIWQHGSNSIEIKLKKVYYNNGHTTEDILLGVHKYIRSGFLIEDYLPIYNELSQNKKGSLYIWVDWHNPNTDSLMGTVRDAPKKNSQYVYIDFLGGNPLKMKCRFTEKGTTITLPTLPGKTLPDGDLIFTKQ